MSDRKQVTIRAVKKVTYERLRDVKEAPRIPPGAVREEAVEQWWNSRHEADDAGCLRSLVSVLIDERGEVRNACPTHTF